MNTIRIVCLLIASFAASIAMATPKCVDLGYGALPGAKANKLFLYFPTADDASFPQFQVDSTTSTQPAHRFDITELTSYTGSANDLKNGVFDVVSDDYCEFNVEVLQTTTLPGGPAPRRNVVSIGTDTSKNAAGTSWSWGLAQNVDSGDGTAIDFAHVWAGTYQFTAGGAGGALQGANSTVTRWATSIGGTAAHEGGHNYGLSHDDGLPVASGEDALTRHVMASGSHYTDEQRAGFRRHFSNHEYEVLAANIGLSVQTMWNWDFINPNAATAVKVRINFLSTQPSLSVAGPYTGSRSPWSAPTVSSALGTQTFNGVTYNRYRVTWSTPQAWDGATPGQVAGGQEFHVGTGFAGVNFNTTNPIIITSVDLIDAANATLALHPRIAGFDAGTLDASDGSFALQAFSVGGAALVISDVRVRFLPRQLSINALLPNAEKIVDIFGAPVAPWREARLKITQGRVGKNLSLRIPIATLAEGPRFIDTVDRDTCKGRSDRSNELPDTRGCKTGKIASLFPSTATYLAATVTDPAAKHWDAEHKAYVVGPLKTQVFYQLAGRHVDLNYNHIDDFVEIAVNPKLDLNKDGVLDRVQKKTGVPPPR